MKILSFNVNGIRACLKNGLIKTIKTEDPDIICLQETKAQQDQLSLSLELPEYFEYWNSAEKKGYSGVLALSKIKAKGIQKEFCEDETINKEGRYLQLEFDKFYLLNSYFPNAQRGLARLEHKLYFNNEFLEHINELKLKKSVIICGDFNVAHQEIDITNPKSNERNAGFSPPEREWFSTLLANGFIDTFRHFFPSLEGQYTWWTYRYNAREKNIGWRLDYFVVNQEFIGNIKSSFILNQIYGSDHCPVGILLKEDK